MYIRKFEPGECYYVEGGYVTDDLYKATKWAEGALPDSGYMMHDQPPEKQRQYVRPYVLWVLMPAPKENEFGLESP